MPYILLGEKEIVIFIAIFILFLFNAFIKTCPTKPSVCFIAGALLQLKCGSQSPSFPSFSAYQMGEELKGSALWQGGEVRGFCQRCLVPAESGGRGTT